MKSKKQNNSSGEKQSFTHKFFNRTVTLHPTVLVLTTYVLLLISKVIDLTLLNRENEYYSIVILQMMIFLLPGAIWCRFSGEKYLGALRLRMIKLDSLPIILSAAVLMASGGLLLGVLFGGTESLAGSFSLYDTFISKHGGTAGNAAYLILTYAALPAFCEELVFRGILCAEYERHGAVCATLLSMLLFNILHFDLRHAPVYLFSGLVLCAVLYATRSLFAAVAVHFGYNLFGNLTATA